MPSVYTHIVPLLSICLIFCPLFSVEELLIHFDDGTQLFGFENP